MEVIYKGKTKDLYRLENGNIMFKFKDDITGADGVADSGGDEVVGSIDGLGNKNLRLSSYFFKKMEENGIPTHFVSADLDDNTMVVKEAKFFGHGVEVITRYKAVGSFIRRYGLYAKENQDLDEYVEFTLKDDERKDPLITRDGLNILGIMDYNQYDIVEDLNRKCARIIKEEIERQGLTLFDLKLEFGIINGKIHLIDEISGGNMRVYKDDQYIEPDNLIDYIL